MKKGLKNNPNKVGWNKDLLYDLFKYLINFFVSF